MKVHFISEENTNIAFFPESKRFFKVNKKALELFKMIQENAEDIHICKVLNISLEELQDYRHKFEEYAKPIMVSNNNLEGSQKVLSRLVIHISNSCNLRCVYCYANGGIYHSEESNLSEEMLRLIIRRFYQEFDKILMIQFFGGEPLINLPLIKSACEKIRKIDEERGYLTKFGLVTNGTLINDDFIEVAKEYEISVTISYDGDVVVNNMLRKFPNGEGVSDIVVKNAKKLKQETNLLQTIEVTYTRQHYQNNVIIMDIIKHIRKEIPETPIHLIPAGGNEFCTYTLPHYEMFKESVDDIFRENENNLYEYNYSLVERLINALTNREVYSSVICDAGVGTLSVSVKGDVYPCFMFTDNNDMILGNIKDDNVFKSKDYISKIQKIKEFSIKENNPKCLNCFIKKMCNGCLGLNMMHSGEPFVLDDQTCNMFCEMAEKVIINIAKRVDKEKEDKINV